MKKPVMHLLAGSNGAGKSTFAKEAFSELLFIDGDAIAKGLQQKYGTDWEKYNTRNEANILAVKLYMKAIEQKIDFAIETNFSFELLERPKRFGYQLNVYFLSTYNYTINIHRVEQRKQAGGHWVPEDLIKQRQQKCITDLCKALPNIDNLFLIASNNNPLQKPTLLAEIYPQKSSIQPYPWIHSYEWTTPVLEAVNKLFL